MKFRELSNRLWGLDPDDKSSYEDCADYKTVTFKLNKLSSENKNEAKGAQLASAAETA